MPSQTPAATATTFFSAPPSSTPTASELLYTRNVALEKCSRIAATRALSLPAATVVAGQPFATSPAMFGPDITAIGRSPVSSARI